MRKILFFISLFIGCMNMTNGGEVKWESNQVNNWQKKIDRKYLLLEGVYFKESRCGKILESKASIKEGSVGPLQIGKGMVDYINKKCKTHFTYEDRKSYEKSVEMFFLYQEINNSNYDLDRGAHIWNAGSGKVKARWGLTENYRKDLKKYIGDRVLS
jgi:hypothetical protein